MKTVRLVVIGISVALEQMFQCQDQIALQWKWQRRSFTLEGVLERATAEAVQRLHHNAQRLLRPLAVVNPYVEQLTYPSDR